MCPSYSTFMKSALLYEHEDLHECKIDVIVFLQIFWKQIQADLSQVDHESLSHDDRVTYLIIKYYAQTILQGHKYGRRQYKIQCIFFQFFFYKGHATTVSVKLLL